VKKTLSIEDHQRLAQHLRTIAAELSTVMEIVSGCGLVSRVGNRLYAAGKKLREVKSVLDGVMARDHRDDPLASPGVYYGREGQCGDGR
jgi:hypothetical protein